MHSMQPFLLSQHPTWAFPICRLGLATRGGTHLQPADVLYALDRGVNFLNWCGQPDALSRTIASLGSRREQVAICVQFEARTAEQAKTELDCILRELNTDYIDVLTFYYVEAGDEWAQIIGPGGALENCRERGKVCLLGVTTHQRSLAVEIARSGLIDLLMIRYNAAHRGAERDIFPVTDSLRMPVVAFTCLRWGGLLESTPDDPPDFRKVRAPDWYRFVLQSSSVTVALMAPDNRAELEEDLSILENEPRLSQEAWQALARHGERVRRHGGSFP